MDAIKATTNNDAKTFLRFFILSNPPCIVVFLGSRLNTKSQATPYPYVFNLTYIAFCSRPAHLTYLEFTTNYIIGFLVSQHLEFKCKEIVIELKQTEILINLDLNT